MGVYHQYLPSTSSSTMHNFLLIIAITYTASAGPQILLNNIQSQWRGLDDYLGFSACYSQAPVVFCTCKDGERIDQAWFIRRGLDKDIASWNPAPQDSMCASSAPFYTPVSCSCPDGETFDPLVEFEQRFGQITVQITSG